MQSGYSPMGGMDSWNPPISFPVNQDNLKWKDEKANTGFYYNHVTKNYEFSTRKLRNGTIRGTLRQQFQFLVPKYPPGTFVIYGCLGVTHFRRSPQVTEQAAAPQRRAAAFAVALGRCRGELRDRGLPVGLLGRGCPPPGGRCRSAGRTAAAERGPTDVVEERDVRAGVDVGVDSAEPSAFITTTE